MLKACAQTRAPTLAASPRQPAAHGGVVDAVLDGVQTTRWKATRQTTRWKATRVTSAACCGSAQQLAMRNEKFTCAKAAL